MESLSQRGWRRSKAFRLGLNNLATGQRFGTSHLLCIFSGKVGSQIFWMRDSVNLAMVVFSKTSGTLEMTNFRRHQFR
jgi:hypothetical protein